ncbi:MAG: PIN domain-containing protein [Candidatus Saccharimonadales bacterium]
MKYIDTNVLVRIITGDDRKLAAQAIAEIQRGGQNEFYILDAVLVELCFVLEFHAYKMTRADVALAVATLVATPQILVADTSVRALQLYGQNPKLDYADCLLCVTGGKDGVLTFDSDLNRALSN